MQGIFIIILLKMGFDYENGLDHLEAAELPVQLCIQAKIAHMYQQ